ncbi:MAG: SGNH/GDSL hydrolase family protein [Ruminococcaceae bacterium]|nr:SGNH/GDSL hydrolase family protein [Oscillospiraceae bacterium]
MDINKLFFDPAEQPLDSFPADGGFVGIFRTIACIGDSLSSGEFVSINGEGRKSWHDMYDYSWGQYIARMAGCKVYNFSSGGMTARIYLDYFADRHGYWSHDLAAQAYIIALGVNDIINDGLELGTVADIDTADYRNNKPTFAGDYGQIIGRYREIQPKAKFFLMTMPHDRGDDSEMIRRAEAHAQLLYDMAELFSNTYVLDFMKYAPVYNEEFQDKFYLVDHMNPMGYLLTARMVVSYIDYIIRHNIKDFVQVPFIGTPFYMDGMEQGK